MGDYSKGDHLVLPHHGAGTVTDVSNRDGESYIQVRFDHRDLDMTIPVALAVERGAREVILKKDAKAILKALKGEGEELPDDHRARARIVETKSASMDPQDLADVVRDVAARRADGARLSAAETRAFDLARDQLASELGLVMDLDREAAFNVIDKAIGEA